MRVGHLLLREHVTRAFVLSDLIDVRINAELVERPAKEHHISSETGNEQFSRRCDVNLVAGRSDVVVLVQAHFHVGIDRLARRAKVLDRAANLFSLGPAYI